MKKQMAAGMQLVAIAGALLLSNACNSERPAKVQQKGRTTMDIIKADKRHFSDFGWLKTYWLFSFSDYFDPQNIQFGALRVFNDDVVQPGTGFPTHPHEEMEIITIVLDGEMTHQDSMGNKAVIRAGDVQRMSAGTGLTHSEFNLAEAPVHFYQIWIFPDQGGLKPSYDQRNFDAESWHNALLPVASGQGLESTVKFHTAATIYRCDLDQGKEVTHTPTAGRRIFVYVTKGELEANGTMISEKDQARIDIDEPLTLKAKESAEFILIDVPSCKGWGYGPNTLKGQRK
jgi:redox-sensitive bicupin YhaK (pirin superfamily)